MNLVEAPRAPRIPAPYTFPTKATLPPGWDHHALTPGLWVYQRDKDRMRVIVEWLDHPFPLVHVSIQFRNRNVKPKDVTYVIRHFLHPDIPVAQMHGPQWNDPSTVRLYQLPDPAAPMIPFPAKFSIPMGTEAEDKLQ